MATKPVRIIELNWPSLAGKALEGGYEIQDLLEADRTHATFKIRVLGAHTVSAHVDLFQVNAAAAQETVDTWYAAKDLKHTNLSSPLASGWTQLDGIDLIYVILNRPDERLSGVLRERPLDSQEAGELLKSLAAGLEYLHAHGFVHGCLSPEQVLSVGPSIQLSTTCIRKINTAPKIELTEPTYVAPENSANITPAADVWCLGATLFEALTQQMWSGGGLQEAQLPPSFTKVVERCLDSDPQTRGKLSEIVPLYNGRSSVTPKLQPATEKQPSVLAEGPAAPQPPVISTRPGHTPIRTWIYAAIGLIIVLAIIWFARPKHPPVTRSAVPTATTVPVPSSPGNAWETRTLTPPDSAKKSAPHQPAPVAKSATSEVTPSHPSALPAKPEPHNVNGSVWRVILYTYARQQDAESKAKSLNEKHPGLNAQVFSPSGNNGLYLVTAGGPMTRDEAVRIRQEARGMGMPRDSYIQNYKQ